MSASIALQSRLCIRDPQGAREAEAHRAEHDVLARLAAVARRAHKVLTPHSRQEFERQLLGERGLRVADLAFALAAMPVPDREWLLAPLLTAPETPSKPVLVEIAEATRATGEALADAELLIASGPCTPQDIRRVECECHTAARELGDVVRAMRSGR